ncbi:hypothetical protein C5B92_07010 [Rathayibacter sp. AY1A4]|uniref:hypothetical protein n=1 Tax=Rathayibacter sp. AY1A4 TaxID=2080522 RepID=UPI000CE72AF5|nr:hypothetical protein [Rathayibacter sp. AY1A4]PPF18258.1 hypothetical protein C5B92_07010 [Rathayibacter sp. AY1A4]
MKWFKRRIRRVDPAELTARAAESVQRVESQQERVNLITAWLISRKESNGFGDDFEYTLKPKGRHP